MIFSPALLQIQSTKTLPFRANHSERQDLIFFLLFPMHHVFISFVNPCLQQTEAEYGYGGWNPEICESGYNITSHRTSLSFQSVTVEHELRLAGITHGVFISSIRVTSNHCTEGRN